MNTTRPNTRKHGIRIVRPACPAPSGAAAGQEAGQAGQPARQKKHPAIPQRFRRREYLLEKGLYRQAEEEGLI